MALMSDGPFRLVSSLAATLPAIKADRVVVLKSERRMVLMKGDDVLKVYRIALGRYPKGHKVKRGDARTPEGQYTIDYRVDSNRSKFYRALHVSYPNSRDRAQAAKLGVHPGGQIMIHGLPLNWSAKDVGHPKLDWTQGCIALTNREMDEVWAMVSDGTRIEIHP
ncbi:MAG: L,D-transpeptidase family protein [Pseudomonadota bacterium]|nr:L,D-transpeptidase family protein [Pseudomonadota bacterium]